MTNGLDTWITERNKMKYYEAEFKNRRGGTVTEKFTAVDEDKAYELIKAHAQSNKLKIHIWRPIEDQSRR